MFHAVVILSGLALSVGRGNWQRWKEYLPTFYYLALFSCFYEYISYIGNKHLWEFDKVFISLFITETLYTFIFYPSIIILFLSNFPEEKTRILWYYVKWISLSVIIEMIALKIGAIRLAHGWSMGWEVFFYTTMYPMLRLHYKKPLIALTLSVFFILFYLLIFDYHLI